MLNQHSTSVSEIVENTQELTDAVLIDTQPEEKRVYQRRAARWSAQVMTKDKTLVQCKTRDVSEKGISITIPYDFRRNALVVVSVNVVYKNIRNTLQVLAQVRHSSIASEGYTIGLLIKDAPEVAVNFLKAYSNKKI